MYTRMAEAHRTCMRMRGNHRGPIYLYKHICTYREREREREEGRRKDSKTEIKKDKKKKKWPRKKSRRCRDGKERVKRRLWWREEETEREGEREKKTGRKAVWCFNRKIRAVGARQACSHHNGSHLRMLLQAWLWLRLTLLGLQHRAALRLSTSAMTCL